MAHISLKDAEKARMQITKEQEEAISKMYHKIYLDFKKQMESLPLQGQGTATQSLKRLYLNRLTKQLKEAYESLGRDLENQITQGMQDTSQAMVSNMGDWLKKIGLNIEEAYSYVPKDIVAMLSTGQVYGDGWTLSKAIWGESQKHSDDIHKIVATGVAANRSAYDIAKDLEKYVNPSAKKEWDWSKVYPGTSKKVDYNAQRLARTMVSHAYQQSLLATTKYNPFVTGYKWRSAHTHRTCEICNERDGQVYTADTLPLDHPNGMCTFLTELSGSLDDIADRLGDWANGKEDAALDKWYNSMNGLPLNSKITHNEKTKAMNQSPVQSKEWVDKNLKNLRLRTSRTFRKGEWESLRNFLTNLSEEQLKWLSLGDGYLKNMQEGSGFWQQGKKLLSLDLKKDSTNQSGTGTYCTLFHEFGHMLDYKLYGGAGTGQLSGTKRVGLPIYKALEKGYNRIVVGGKIPDHIKFDLMGDNTSSGVQDIISGFSKDSLRIKWGHTKEYWTRTPPQNQWKEVTSEVWAHMNSAYILGGKQEEHMKTYFPEAYELFLQEVKDRVG